MCTYIHRYCLCIYIYAHICQFLAIPMSELCFYPSWECTKTRWLQDLYTCIGEKNTWQVNSWHLKCGHWMILSCVQRIHKLPVLFGPSISPWFSMNFPGAQVASPGACFAPRSEHPQRWKCDSPTIDPPGHGRSSSIFGTWWICGYVLLYYIYIVHVIYIYIYILIYIKYILIMYIIYINNIHNIY